MSGTGQAAVKTVACSYCTKPAIYIGDGQDGDSYCEDDKRRAPGTVSLRTLTMAELRPNCVHPDPITDAELAELAALSGAEEAAWQVSRHGGFKNRYLSKARAGGVGTPSFDIWTYEAQDGCSFGVHRWPGDA